MATEMLIPEHELIHQNEHKSAESNAELRAAEQSSEQTGQPQTLEAMLEHYGQLLDQFDREQTAENLEALVAVSRVILEQQIKQYNQLLNQFKSEQTAANLEPLRKQGKEIRDFNEQVIELLQRDARLGAPRLALHQALEQHLAEQLDTLEVQRNRFVDGIKKTLRIPGN